MNYKTPRRKSLAEYEGSKTMGPVYSIFRLLLSSRTFIFNVFPFFPQTEFEMTSGGGKKKIV